MLGTMGLIRKSAVAGRFYPGSAEELRASVDRLIEPVEAAPALTDAIAVMAPHAGYLYSGATAGRVFAAVRVPDKVIILCPNHTGFGPTVSVWPRGNWQFPFGEVPSDERLAAEIMESHPGFEPDRRAHLMEHAIEVEVPFLAARNPNVRLAAVVVSRLQRDDALTLGKALARVVKAHEEPILMVISSDMSHYIPAREAEARDRLALDKIEALDPAGLYDVVTTKNISMCGIMPATVGLAAAVELGATRARLVDYTHSGQVTGDHDSVVAYAGVVVE
jgi:AmmeMemoRadiSam system protein B